jgi:hypothetical protein
MRPPGLKARWKEVEYRMKFARTLLASSAGVLVASAAVVASPLLSVVSTRGVPGGTVNVAINYTTDTNLTGLQFDLLFNTNYLQWGPPVRGDALSDQFLLGTNLIAPGQFRILVISSIRTPMSNGVVVYMPFTIASNAPDHDESLTFTNVSATDAAAEEVALPSTNGVLAVVVPPQISGFMPTSGGVMHLALAGSPGRNYIIQATTNLAAPQWLSFTNVLAGGNPVFDDATTSNFPVRFYRALVAQ